MSKDQTTGHLCLTCQLADWQKTSAGRNHPNGQGRCTWSPPYIPTPAAWTWNVSHREQQPVPQWGWIERKPPKPIAECETYREAVNHAAA